MSNGSISIDELTYYGVSLIFLFYGIKISPSTLRMGLSNWKLHLLIQSTTFIVFPLLILILYWFFGSENNLFWLGTFYLAALPSTVSSSVVMVSIAGGNLPAAIFNASVSSIIGIMITPLWMGLFLSAENANFELINTVWALVQQVLIPVVIGIFLHKWLFKWVQKYNKTLKNFDQLVILLIVFSAFSHSFGGNMFEGQNILTLGFWMLLLFCFMAGGMYLLGRWLSFDRGDQITVLFCGSKKSLVQGAVMGKILFPDPLVFGVVLLPLMMYHTLQLILGTALAERMALSEGERSNDIRV